MSVESVFEDTVRICEFYADPCESFEVDSENHIVLVGGRKIHPVTADGELDHYLVIYTDGLYYSVDDLDSYFQWLFDWSER